MLNIIRVQPTGSAITTFLDASVTLRQGKHNVEGCPDLTFSIKTYEKIARDNSTNAKMINDGRADEGDRILLPVNLFFGTLDFDAQKSLYELYRFSRQIISTMTKDNRREVSDILQQRIFDTIERLDICQKLIAFCQTSQFIYPNLDDIGNKPHHSPEKTYLEYDYVEITAISLLSKMMVPIWGEFIKELSDVDISRNQREKISFDLIEPSLEEGAFERIYNKLSYSVSSLVEERRDTADKKTAMSGPVKVSSFIITHNGIDDEMFDKIVMSAIIVKRMATYECFVRVKDNNIPNAMVYINDGIKRTVESSLQNMRQSMNTMPRRELADHDTEDNSSILDHASKTSKKPIDVPILVVTAVETWELPRLVKDTNTPEDLYEAASLYYTTNGFDITPLCQAMVACFVGTRFGGSKCLSYLPPLMYQRLVVLLQIFLIRQEMYDLAALVSSNTSALPIDGPTSPIASRIEATYTSEEYQQCKTLFKGFLEKPVNKILKKKTTKRSEEMETIDFTNHIKRLADWITKYNHSENMAPVLWNFAQRENRPIVGSEVQFDEKIIRNLCRFYLMFHGGQRPF